MPGQPRSWLRNADFSDGDAGSTWIFRCSAPCGDQRNLIHCVALEAAVRIGPVALLTHRPPRTRLVLTSEVAPDSRTSGSDLSTRESWLTANPGRLPDAGLAELRHEFPDGGDPLHVPRTGPAGPGSTASDDDRGSSLRPESDVCPHSRRKDEQARKSDSGRRVGSRLGPDLHWQIFTRSPFEPRTVVESCVVMPEEVERE